MRLAACLIELVSQVRDLRVARPRSRPNVRARFYPSSVALCIGGVTRPASLGLLAQCV
jgi:hypothetical protein